MQALCLGVVGGVLGVAATIPLAAGLNVVAASIVGFENVVRTPPWVLGAGVAIAVPISLIGAAVAGWQVSKLSPVDVLR